MQLFFSCRAKPFSLAARGSGVDKIGVFCGWKLVHCPGGCDDTLAKCSQ